MAIEKVFCENCIFYVPGEVIPLDFGPPEHQRQKCLSPSNYKNTNVAPKELPISQPQIINQFNDCSWFSPKHGPNSSSSSSSGSEITFLYISDPHQLIGNEFTVIGSEVIYDLVNNTARLATPESVSRIECNNKNLAGIINVSNCPNLTRLECNTNAINTLIIAGANRLTILDCSDNVLSSLNVSGCLDLTIFNCSNNSISSLNISNLTNLNIFNATNNSLDQASVDNILVTLSENELSDGECKISQGTNAIPSTESLNIARRTLQKAGWKVATNVPPFYSGGTYTLTGNEFDIYGTTVIYDYENNTARFENPESAIEINIESISNLDGIIDISGCNHLLYFYIYDTAIPSIDASYLLELNELQISSNSNISSIFTTGCNNLVEISCYENSNLNILNLTDCQSLQYLDCSSCSIQTLYFKNCNQLSYIECSNNESLTLIAGLSELRQLMQLDCNNTSISSLDGLAGKSYFNSLNINSCTQITSLDVSGCAQLSNIYANGASSLSSVNISGCSLLNYSDFQNDSLTQNSIDSILASLVAGSVNRGRVFLTGTGNSYPSLSGIVNANILLSYPRYWSAVTFNPQPVVAKQIFSGSGLTDGAFLVTGSSVTYDLEATPQTAVLDDSLNAISVNCEGASLTGSLDLSGCYQLQGVLCNNNQFNSINITGCLSLNNFDCSSNNITSIDVSTCVNLSRFICWMNPLLTSVTFSGLTSLNTIGCGQSALTTIDATGCTNLTQLDCSDDSLLTTVNITNCPNLTFVYLPYAALTLNTVDTILATLVSNGLSGSYDCYMNGGTSSPPTDSSKVSILFNRGWFVSVNGGS